MYQQFMDFIKAKQTSEETPSYAAIVNEEVMDAIEVYAENEKDEVILHLEGNNLQWKNDPWQLMSRYLDTTSYTATSYKSGCTMR